MEPRPAATLVLARRADPGVEVLTLTRGRGTTFAPGFTVFPGGTLDREDATLAERLFGDPAEAARACALRELAEETGIRLDGALAADLPEIARWIAPEFLEMRFDARFFAAAAPGGAEPAPDGSEIADAAWRRPEDVLAAAERGAATLMWPTLITLRALARCETVEEVLALKVEQIGRPDGPSRPLAAAPPEAPA